MDEKKGEFLEQSLALDREVITVGLGACGNRISCGFWRNILDEHSLDFDGTIIETDINDDYIVDNTRIGTYFRELKDTANKYVPRNIICDLDITTIDSVRASNLGSLFNADSYIYAGNSANNLYSLGYNSCIIDDIFEEIRLEAEKCSSVQGFKLLHSVGGGTGSGLTAYLSQLLKDEFYDRLITSYTVYPSNKASDIVIEPYNMVLSMPSLLSYHDINACIDNETLFDISSRLFHNERPNFSDLNEYISNIISSSTAGLRFKGSLNMDLRKLAVNVIPFPRLHFLSISDAPLMYNHNRKYTKINIDTLITELFHSQQFLSHNDDVEYSKYLAASVIFRGQPKNEFNILLNEYEIEYGLKRVFDELGTKMMCNELGYNVLHSTLVYQPSQSYPLTATLFANNTSIAGLFARNLTRFMKFYHKKAFVQYYTQNGTGEEDFEEAIHEIKDLLEEYNEKDSSLQSCSDYELNTSNRKKLQKNNVFWSQFNKKRKVKKKRKRKFKPVVRKNKKVYVKSNNKRVVIISHSRRQEINKNYKKAQNKRKKMKKKNKQKHKSDSDDFEEESSSDDSNSDSTNSSSHSSSDTDKSSGNDSSDGSSDGSSNSESEDDESIDNSSDTNTDSNSNSDANTDKDTSSDSEKTDTDSDANVSSNSEASEL